MGSIALRRDRGEHLSGTTCVKPARDLQIVSSPVTLCQNIKKKTASEDVIAGFIWIIL